MLKLKEAVIVEGKYDKIKLDSILDACILTTDGFGIFKDKEKQKLIRRLAKEKGIIVLTDSDSAGFVIRSFLSGIVPKEQIKNVYIPDIFGKEKRKEAYSKEGKLGVEGMEKKVLLEAFQKASIFTEESSSPLQQKREITQTDLYEDGLSGGENSAERRKQLLKNLDLPQHLSKNAMLQMLNLFLTYEEYQQEVKKLEE